MAGQQGCWSRSPGVSTRGTRLERVADVRGCRGAACRGGRRAGGCRPVAGAESTECWASCVVLRGVSIRSRDASGRATGRTRRLAVTMPFRVRPSRCGVGLRRARRRGISIAPTSRLPSPLMPHESVASPRAAEEQVRPPTAAALRRLRRPPHRRGGDGVLPARHAVPHRPERDQSPPGQQDVRRRDLRAAPPARRHPQERPDSRSAPRGRLRDVSMAARPWTRPPVAAVHRARVRPSTTASRVPIFGRADRAAAPDRAEPGRPGRRTAAPRWRGTTRTVHAQHLYCDPPGARRDGARAEGLLVGEINADYLWATFDQSLIAAGTILTVKDDSGHVLVSSVAGAHSAFQTLGLDARARCRFARHACDRDPYVSSTWPILLDEVFAAPTWNLVLGHSETGSAGAGASGSPIRCSMVVLGLHRLGAGPERAPHPAEPGSAPRAAGRDPPHRRAATSAAASPSAAGTSSRSWAPRSTRWRPSSTGNSRPSRPPPRSTGRCSRPPAPARSWPRCSRASPTSIPAAP